ncbi:hypothetical protein PR202_ga13196 [Eleusine coracana subsp. coracana]|uniref:Uncharacterized protein n=1 Tax=Eleusine coracana subsp. coracana TaxID=191504 RepID=A0AAV5CEA9_ELECO|nr:hypothetical protein PR202_ga13196 [Eleusine coracana subsp. coracana]
MTTSGPAPALLPSLPPLERQARDAATDSDKWSIPTPGTPLNKCVKWLQHGGDVLVLFETPSGFALFSFNGVKFFRPKAEENVWADFTVSSKAEHLISCPEEEVEVMFDNHRIKVLSELETRRLVSDAPQYKDMLDERSCLKVYKHILHASKVAIKALKVLSLSCLSSPPPRRSARPPSAAALSRPKRSCPSQVAGAPCTWRSRAGAASRPAHSGRLEERRGGKKRWRGGEAEERNGCAGARRARTRRGDWSREEPAEEGEPLGFEVSTEPMPELQDPDKPDFWEGPQWEPLGFFVQYMWAFGVVFGLVACGVAVATYNDGATDFRDTPAYKESLQSQEFPEESESSGADVFEGNPTEVAPALE